MPRIAFLSTDNLEAFFVYDDLLVKPLSRVGWQVDTVSWRKQGVDWNVYDLVIVRSTWDYQQAAPDFLACLQRIESSSAVLENPLALIKWNIEKTYLKELAQQGLPVVPTYWADTFNPAEAAEQFSHFNTSEIIIKPVLSANADHTYRLCKEDLAAQATELHVQLGNRELMIQPFIRAVLEEGEYSLFYFAHRYSHAIIKQPAAGDFRVQEEHGGILHVCEPSDDMLKLAENVLGALPEPSLYARIDLIRLDTGWAVMEVELIEPSLYFQLDSKAPQRFVEAVSSRYGRAC